MSFRLESDLVKCLKDQLPKPFARFFGRNKVAVATEVPVNARVVDIVMVGYSHHSMGCDLLKALSNLTQIELDILSALTRNRTWTVDELSYEMFMDKERLSNFLQPQVKRGLIKNYKNGTFGATSWAKVLPPCMIAIEAKISKWEEALIQAQRHTSFADYSLVALDGSAFTDSRLEEIKGKFFESQIGLITVKSDGSIKSLVPCKKHAGSDRERTLQRIRALRDLSFKHGTASPRSKFKLLSSSTQVLSIDQ